jgi:cell division protein ZapA
LSEQVRVNVRILEKEYQVGCAPEDKAALLESAELLNAKMREIRDTGRVVGLERIAVMAALNIANEFIRNRGQGDSLETRAKARVKAMRERVEGALQNGRQLEF